MGDKRCICQSPDLAGSSLIFLGHFQTRDLGQTQSPTSILRTASVSCNKSAACDDAKDTQYGTTSGDLPSVICMSCICVSFSSRVCTDSFSAG